MTIVRMMCKCVSLHEAICVDFTIFLSSCKIIHYTVQRTFAEFLLHLDVTCTGILVKVVSFSLSIMLRWFGFNDLIHGKLAIK